METTSRTHNSSIYQKQNNPFLLKCRHAQKMIYDEARKFMSYKYYTIFALLCISLYVTYLRVEYYSGLLNIVTVIQLIMVEWFGNKSRQKCTEAANIQQYIDVTLYAPLISSDPSEWGVYQSQHDISEIVCNYTTPRTGLSDWYSDYSGCSPLKQVFYSQRENIRWDTTLKKWYISIIYAAFFCFIILLLFAIYIKVNQYLEIFEIAALIIAIIWPCLLDVMRLRDDINRLDRIKHMASVYSQDIISDDTLSKTNKSKLITLQFKIYEHRKCAILIPNILYKISHSSLSEFENRIASDTIHSTKEN